MPVPQFPEPQIPDWFMRSFTKAAVLALGTLLFAPFAGQAHANPFDQPWRNKDRALVIDAYEFNEIEWDKMIADKRIVGFIGKASDGLPERYRCTGNETERAMCKTKWRRYVVTKELYHTRRTLAKALGLKWGAYHMARPGNPLEQADHFIDFADPQPDELIALDIEGIDPDKWMSLEDAELFARRIHQRLNRWPMLYVNGSTARHIADNRSTLNILSRLPLWYARFAPSIEGHFPKGNWQSYDLWQFAASANCNRRTCPYRVPGTPLDIDVNVADMTPEALRLAWPFNALKPALDDAGEGDLIAAGPLIGRLAAEASLRVPLPHQAPRNKAPFSGITFAMADNLPLLPNAFLDSHDAQRAALRRHHDWHSEQVSATPVTVDGPAIDPVITASIPLHYPHPGGADQAEVDSAFAAMSERQKPSAHVMQFTPR